MQTRVVKIDPENINLAKIKQAADVINKGGIVAFPTETVYGLAADFLNREAVERVFAVKKRPKDKPLTVQIQDINCLDRLAKDIPAFAYQLMSKFWPGPLTLVLPAKAGGTSPFAEELPPSASGDSPPKPKTKVLGRRRTIGLRIPANKIARELIKQCQSHLVVPSANLSGEPAAKTAEEVLQTFDGLIEMVIDGGPVELGVASTVVDVSITPYKILREGSITKEEIQSVQG